MPTFKEKFETLRRRNGVTIRDVATALNVGVGTVGGWAKGSTPRPEVAKRLADFFSVSVDDLLRDELELMIDIVRDMQVAEAQAAQKYPGNSQARDENFDAQFFERQTRQERLAHAASLRAVAKTLSQQASQILTKAEKLEALPPTVVTSNTTPKPDSTVRAQAQEAAKRRLQKKHPLPGEQSA